MITSKFRTVFSFINYWLKAVDKHSLQSPFSFEFYQKIIASKISSHVFFEIEELRQKLRHDPRSIEIKDYGAGSKVHDSKRRKVSEIIRSGISSPRFSQMLFRIALTYQPRNIVEFGTSLGINTLYLAKASNQNKVTTFEGCPQLTAIAKENFTHFQQNNIELIEGDLDHTLPAYLATADQVDLVFFDANHQLEATLRYFNQCLDKVHRDSIFVFDDIHWSAGMEKAWSKIKSEPKVSLSFDLFQAGIIFFTPTKSKQEYIIEAPFW